MFEFFIGLFLTFFSNSVFTGNKEPPPRYWDDGKTYEEVYGKLDSVLFENVYLFDSTRKWQTKSPIRTADVVMPDSVTLESLRLDGL